MPDDDRKILFLSFAATLKLIAANRITKWGIASGNPYYKELMEGLYYLDYSEKFIKHPARFNYEGFFDADAHIILVTQLEKLKQNFPLSKQSRKSAALTNEEITAAEEYVGHVVFRELGADRQLRRLNSLLKSNDIEPIDPNDASTFHEGITILRRRCVFKEIAE